MESMQFIFIYVYLYKIQKETIRKVNTFRDNEYGKRITL